MNRFFVDLSQIDIENNKINILGEDVKHITKVLRLTKGDQVEVCDGQNKEYIGQIEEATKDKICLTIVKTKDSLGEPPIEVILYQGIPKGSKMELIIQKTVEMGISKIVPVEMERTVVQFSGQKDREKKVDRWQKIATEASKQSKRGIIPIVCLPMTMEEALKHSQENHLNILAYENEENRGLKALLRNISLENMGEMLRIGIWIGPEGGFEAEEIEKALSYNIYSLTLGPRILRTETAGLTLLGLVMYELGDLGGA